MCRLLQRSSEQVTDTFHNVRVIDAAVIFKQCLRPDCAVQDAGIQCEELRRRTPSDNKWSIIRIRILSRCDSLLDIQSLID
jgi:hypothetical protein